MTQRNSPGPDFLGIGAQKSGTTWLHQMFTAHPQVWMPPEKELHFFDERRHDPAGPLRRLRGDSTEAERWRRQIRRQWRSVLRRDISWEDLAWYLRYFARRADVFWYRGLFTAPDSMISGEITPNYSRLSLDDVRWVQDAIGDARIIFLIRNPIERVWSHAQMMQRAQDRRAAEFVDDLLTRPSFRDLSDYQRTIRFWSSTFGADKFYLGLMEDLTFGPRNLVDSVCDFLGVGDPTSYPVAGRAVHRGGHSTIDTDVAVRLADHFHEDLVSMSDTIGGWTRWWRFTAEQLLTDPPESETLPYPLWESELWERWDNAPESRVVSSLRSGPLPRVHAWYSQERDALAGGSLNSEA